MDGKQSLMSDNTSELSAEKSHSVNHLGIPSSYNRGVRKRSFDDAQSRLKSRKILGLGGKESSKVLQVLGNCEHLETKLPIGLSLWLTFSSLMFLAMALLCILLFKPFSYLLGVDHSPRINVMEVRLLGATFAGLSGLTWLTNATSYFVLRNVLLTHLVYFGIAALVFTRELYVEYNKYIGLSLIFHVAIFFVTLAYVIMLQRVNQPVPDKPVSFADSDDGEAFN
ncbi:tumor protein p53-inducible protein 11-like isoform X1 [Dendronephthya gigantea]|uniref:tumor protein p53-inducible protein 11-like isoform X1 n=1 Tax=Dendronephthya gigantea TaxID=151771 RepID=UPI00106BE733|nr:tumor protein p53-inducible protein 11-like isoform X1 [Dendronephthya gigantea]